MSFFLILTAVIALILLICLFFQSRKSAPPDTSTYTPPSYLQEETIAQRPKISAEVSDDFYYAVKQYCSDHSMTTSVLIRTAVSEYMSNSATASVQQHIDPKPVTKRTCKVLQSPTLPASWKCPSADISRSLHWNLCVRCNTGISLPNVLTYVRTDGSGNVEMPSKTQATLEPVSAGLQKSDLYPLRYEGGFFPSAVTL